MSDCSDVRFKCYKSPIWKMMSYHLDNTTAIDAIKKAHYTKLALQPDFARLIELCSCIKDQYSQPYCNFTMRCVCGAVRRPRRSTCTCRICRLPLRQLNCLCTSRGLRRGAVPCGATLRDFFFRCANAHRFGMAGQRCAGDVWSAGTNASLDSHVLILPNVHGDCLPCGPCPLFQTDELFLAWGSHRLRQQPHGKGRPEQIRSPCLCGDFDFVPYQFGAGLLP